MILTTVGTMLPFDRLIRSMDVWAAAHPGEDVFAQIGEGKYEPQHMRFSRMLSPGEFSELVQKSSLIVAHAGTGSFFLAMEFRKPIVLVPRYARFYEHTTDHQVHTANWLRAKPGVFVALTDEEIPGAIQKAQDQNTQNTSVFSPYAPKIFIDRLHEFLDN
jgi:UDP-N-acetylglucosamine transferase subunit ALG13